MNLTELYAAKLLYKKYKLMVVHDNGRFYIASQPHHRDVMIAKKFGLTHEKYKEILFRFDGYEKDKDSIYFYSYTDALMAIRFLYRSLNDLKEGAL